MALVLTRQKLPVIDRTRYAPAAGLARGAYVLADAAGVGPGGGAAGGGAAAEPEIILIATGSEVHLALEAHERLGAEGVRSRVVSMPCRELFFAQEPAYRDAVLPPQVGEAAVDRGGRHLRLARRGR